MDVYVAARPLHYRVKRADTPKHKGCRSCKKKHCYQRAAPLHEVKQVHIFQGFMLEAVDLPGVRGLVEQARQRRQEVRAPPPLPQQQRLHWRLEGPGALRLVDEVQRCPLAPPAQTPHPQSGWQKTSCWFS